MFTYTTHFDCSKYFAMAVYYGNNLDLGMVWVNVFVVVVVVAVVVAEPVAVVDNEVVFLIVL